MSQTCLCMFECLLWTAVAGKRGGALGAIDPEVAYALLEEVAINPTIKPPELTQDWGNRPLEGTNKALCTSGPRRKWSSDPRD